MATELINKSENVSFQNKKKQQTIVWEIYERENDTRTITKFDLFISGKYKVAYKQETIVGLKDDFYREGKSIEIDFKEALKSIEQLEKQTLDCKEKSSMFVGSTQITSWRNKVHKCSR